MTVPGQVTRVHTDSGSYIDPALCATWPDLTRLEWACAVALVDSGLKLTVTEMGEGWFCVSSGASSIAVDSYLRAWDLITAASWGVRRMADQTVDTEG